MELDVKVAGKSLSIPIPDPFRLDVESLVARIESFLLLKARRQQGLIFAVWCRS